MDPDYVDCITCSPLLITCSSCDLILDSVRWSKIKPLWLSILCIVLLYLCSSLLLPSAIISPRYLTLNVDQFSVATKKCWNVAAQVCDVDEILSFYKIRYLILYFLIKISTLAFLSFVSSLLTADIAVQGGLLFVFLFWLVTGGCIFLLFVSGLQLLNKTRQSSSQSGTQL